MPAPIPDDGMLLEFGRWIVSALLGFIGLVITVLGGRIVKKHDEEIASIKKGIVEVSDKFSRLQVKLSEDYVPQIIYETNRRERRQAEVAIHEKIAATADDIHKKIDAEAREARGRHDQVVGLLMRRRDIHRGDDA